MRILLKQNSLSSNITLKLILLLILAGNISFSQVINNPIPNINGIDNSSSFFEIRDAMNKYWNDQNVNNNGLTKVNGIESKVPDWKRFKRWEYFWEQRVDPVTGAFPQTNSIIEYNKYITNNHSLKKTDDYTSSWSNLGTNSSSGGYAGIGRINCIAFHPTDINTFWVGSPSGGVWKTTNGGSSWTILNNNEAVIGVSCIVVPSDYATSNTLYIATGDRDGGSLWSLSGGQSADNVSNGVYKSTDGGTTWNATGLTFNVSDMALIYSLVLHPTNNSILFAATSEGLYKSTDAGSTWTQKTTNVWNDIEFQPGNPAIMYATSITYGSTYFCKSTNSGETWPFAVITSSGRRGEIAVSPADPNVVYLLSANTSGGVYAVYKSTDSGVNFTAVNSGSPAGMLGYYTDGSGGSGGQGSYDWCIAVDPANANTVFIGGITTWKSTDGGTNFTANTCWTSSSFYNFSGVPVVHADKHVLAYQNNTTLFEGNDGGIYKTTNGGTNWTDLTNGIVISQIYRLGVSQTDANKVITGLQDNGSKLFNTGFWSDVTGGDGMECIIDYSNTNYMYATYIRGKIYRSTNGGSTFPTTISDNIPGPPTGAWVTPYVIDQNNSATLFAGYDQVWKTTDRGNNWTSASQVLSSSTKLRSLAIAPSNSNILYAADQTNMWKTTDGGATNWSTITLPTTSSSVTYIAVKNNDPNTVWITYGGYNDGLKVYESTNGGTTWTNISAGLPNLPVMCITHYKTITERNVLFVGTDVGVYIKDGSSNWVSFSSGLPNVVVTELDINYGTTDKLRAATFGRGLWETEITGAVPVELISFTATTLGNAIKLNWKTVTEVNNFGFEIERKILKQVQNDSWEKIGFVNGNGNSNSPKDYSFVDDKVSNGIYSYRLKQIDNDGKFEYSNVIEVDYKVISKYELSQNYPNPFNPTTKISWQSPVNSHQTLRVYDVLGNEVATLVNEYREAGIYELNYDASNLPSGVYIYKLQAGEFIATRKMTLVK